MNKTTLVTLILSSMLLAELSPDTSKFKYNGYILFKADCGIGYTRIENIKVNEYLSASHYPKLPSYLISAPIALSVGGLRWQNEVQVQFNNTNELNINNKRSDIYETALSLQHFFKEYYNTRFESSSFIGISVSDLCLKIQDTTYEKVLYTIKIGKEICLFSKNHLTHQYGCHLAIRFTYNIPLNPKTKMNWREDETIIFPHQLTPTGININIVFGYNAWGP